MTSRLIPSGDVAEISENWSGQTNAFCTNGWRCGHGSLNQSPKSPGGVWLKLTMLVLPLSIEEERVASEVRFLTSGNDQLNKSCGRILAGGGTVQVTSI